MGTTRWNLWQVPRPQVDLGQDTGFEPSSGLLQALIAEDVELVGGHVRRREPDRLRMGWCRAATDWRFGY